MEKQYTFMILLLALLTGRSQAQQFTKITDDNNPIVAEAPTPGYTGASWIDINNDGWLELFVNQNFLYLNNGDGTFTSLTNSGITGVSNGINNGHTWGDYDNDGFVDVYLANDQSALYRNNGDNTFSAVTTGDIATAVDGWSAAWADYTGDGYLDLVVTHPCGFIGPCHPNWLFNSNGDGTFTEVTTSDVTDDLAAYTVSSWSDYDGDGDQDLFIGSGEVGFLSKDHIYINQLIPTGTASLVREENGVLFGDFRDGQNWNWIDYDNDGDLDGFVTNYFNTKPNDFYRNDGNGTFVQLTDSDLGGAGMVSDNSAWLTNLWGDFDNDGDLDAFVVSDGGLDRYYVNNGDGTFDSVSDAMTIPGPTRGASAGDYDNDGDLDLYVNSSGQSTKGLYQNDGNSNHWINLSLKGTASNASAIGTKVRIRAMIDGNPVWQMREVSAQSSFCGSNSLRVHFGLGDATTVDSLLIEWPSGLTELCTGLSSDQFYDYEEGDCIVVSNYPLPDPVVLRSFPNPVNNGDSITIEWGETVISADATLRLYNQQGQLLQTYAARDLRQSERQLHLPIKALAAGSYTLKLDSNGQIFHSQLIVME